MAVGAGRRRSGQPVRRPRRPPPTPANIALLTRSRVEPTRALALATGERPDRTWIQMSTLAIYGDGGEAVLDETAPPRTAAADGRRRPRPGRRGAPAPRPTSGRAAHRHRVGARHSGARPPDRLVRGLGGRIGGRPAMGQLAAHRRPARHRAPLPRRPVASGRRCTRQSPSRSATATSWPRYDTSCTARRHRPRRRHSYGSAPSSAHRPGAGAAGRRCVPPAARRGLQVRLPKASARTGPPALTRRLPHGGRPADRRRGLSVLHRRSSAITTSSSARLPLMA